MTSTDKRTVVTDALETLGLCPIPDDSGRDAIHLAVEPVIAAELLLPGQHVGLLDDGRASSKAGKFLGIVDPFIHGPVGPGQRFWFIVYPRQITSLRHVWTHPDFAETGDLPDVEPAPGSDIAWAEEWLRNYATEIDEGFGTLMQAADNWVESGEWFYGAMTHGYRGKFEGESTHPDFWHHYQIYRGKSVDPNKQHSFFTCSC